MAIVVSFIGLLPETSDAHGIAGKRFFPTTFAVDDPFVSDEFSLLIDHRKMPGDGESPSFLSTTFSTELSKRITPAFGISVGESWQRIKPDGGPATTGFNNLELSMKYQFLTSDVHEAIASLGLGVELGGTGTKRIGAESFSVISPTINFGKGFGDLPDSLSFLKPLAVTGSIGPNFPTRSKNVTVTTDQSPDGDIVQTTQVDRNPTTLTWGFTIQYSLMYLQQFVKDIGLGTPLNRMILVIEFPMETCLNAGCKGRTTGTINPGVVWAGKYMQFGVAAEIPINSRSGRHVGVLGLFHLFVDDLFPNSFGKPLFP
ncbi:MAG TPA: hypothetical protein VK445_08040 [Dissulfurispiraceae bacterium]|nr:hypothetical protein [Dissulfurispiraceae bacterium]